jgi:hypothetical protein
VFWDSQGPVTEDYQERGTTVTSVRYGDMWNELKPAIRKERRGRLSQVLFFCCTTTPAFILLPIPRNLFL